MADDAGALLVRAGLISSHHLAAARALQAADGGTVGEHLVAVGAVTDEALTEFYRSRLMVPQVNPNTLARLANTVVSVLPGDMAVEFRAVPVSLDKDGNLMVAMSDPSDRHAVDEIAFFTGKYVVRAVATQMQIAWCLAQYYGHVTELGERLLQPAPAEAGAAPTAKPAEPAAPKPTRQKGDTARVQASRHRVMAPVTSPPPMGPRPGPESLSRDAREEPTPAPKVPSPAELAAAEAEGPIEMEMLVDDPSGPVRLPSDMPANMLSAAANAAAVATQAAQDAVAEQPPGVEGGSPTIIISREATTPKRKRPALPDPPELAARSGEMEIHQYLEHAVDAIASIEVHLEEDEPAIVIAPPPPVVIEDSTGSGSTPRPISDNDRADTEDDEEDESAPILLDKPRRPESSPAIVVDTVPIADTAPTAISEPTPSAPAAAAAPAPVIVQDEPSGPVLLLERKKSPTARRDKRTQLGIGVFTATLGPIPRSPETDAAAAAAATAAASAAAAAAATIAASAAAGPAQPEAVPSVMHDDDNAKTRRHAARSTPSAVDDGWGPPGTTIPPPFLGAVVPADDPASGRIPLPGDGADSAPLVLSQPKAPAAPAPEPSKRNVASPSSGPFGDAAEQARALEAAAIKLVEILRSFDNATSRDHVIAMLVDFVSDSHHRVAFLAAKPGSLHAFMQNPPPGGPQASLPLSAPSVFQDVVGTRLPYRGPISDPVSREFVRALFGSTTDEMLAVPVAVRERVVGVIYADGRQRRAFDEHVAVAARAAGMALERLLKTKKS